MSELLSLLRVIDANKTHREINLQRLTHLLASDTEAQENFFLHDGSRVILNLLTSKNWNIINETLCALSYAAINHNGCKTALTSKKVFNTLFGILHNIQCDNFTTAIYAMFFMSSIMSGNSEAQSIVRQTGCLQYLNNIFSKMGKSVIDFSDENVFHLLNATWRTLCSTLVTSMNHPENYENQAMIGLIMPEAVKMLSYLLQSILQKRKRFKNFEELIFNLIPVIVSMMLNNPENQLKFSLYHGLKTVVNALIKLDKLFYVVSHSEILMKKLLEILCVSVKENRDNCYQAGMLGILSVLTNMLFKVKDAVSVLFAVAHLLYNCNENITIFIKDGGILVLPTAVKKLNLPSEVINIVNFLQKLCEEHIYTNKSLNSSIHKNCSANQIDEIKDSHVSSNSSLLEENYDVGKYFVNNDVYADRLKRARSKKLSETSISVKNTINGKYKITNKFNRQKRYHYAHDDVLSNTNDDLSTHKRYSNLKVPKNITTPSCLKQNKSQRFIGNEFIEMNLSSNILPKNSDLYKNTNNRKYKITDSVNSHQAHSYSSNDHSAILECNSSLEENRKYKITDSVNSQKKQHQAHSYSSNNNSAILECNSSLEVPMNITHVTCPRINSLQRTNVNKFIGSSELLSFSKSQKSHISEMNTSPRLFNEYSSVEDEVGNGVLFKTLLPDYEPGVISTLYLKTVVDKTPTDNIDPHFLNHFPNSNSPQSTQQNLEDKNTFSNHLSQTIDNVCRNILTNNKPEIISKQDCGILNQERKSESLNNTDLIRKSENIYSNINCNHENKQSVVSNKPLVSDTKVLKHFFLRKSEKALMEVLYGEKMGLKKDKMAHKKVLHHGNDCLKNDSKPSENTSRLRKNFYRILMEKADQNLQIHKEGKKDSTCVPFSEEELTNLVSGVSKFGLDFKTIRRAYVFHEKRTSKELYLKWKTCFMTTANDS